MMSRLMKLIIRLGPKEIKETDPSNNWQKKKYSKCRLLSARLFQQKQAEPSSGVFVRHLRSDEAVLICAHWSLGSSLSQSSFSSVMCLGMWQQIAVHWCVQGSLHPWENGSATAQILKPGQTFEAVPSSLIKWKKVKLQDEEDDGPTQKGH